MKAKKVVAMGDTHCGHVTGLCPPSDFLPSNKAIGKAQRERWDAFERMWKGWRGCDVLLFLGDAIDGKGKRAGCTEQFTTDRMEQAHMAAEILRWTKAKAIVMVYGTPYHTGEEEDFEQLVAKECGAQKLGGHEWVDVDGVVFDIKHKVGSSSIPHGRHTAISRERLWNQLWAERGNCPKADVMIRGHVHYHAFAGGPDWLALTLPALQGLGSKYGTRQCSGVVDFGMVKFTVQGGEYQWQADTRRIEAEQSQAIKI